MWGPDLALKDTKGTCDDEMIVPFVALTIEAAVVRTPISQRGSYRMTAPMIAGQILHFKGVVSE